MNAKKIILIIMLLIAFSLAIGGVSAVKYQAPCHGGDLKHNTTWEIKYDGDKVYDGIIKKNGKFYKKYYRLYSNSVIGCTHKSHEKYNLMQGLPKDTPYSYVNTGGMGGRGILPDYSYKYIGKKYTEYVKVGDDSNSVTNFTGKPYKDIVISTTKNFVITNTMKYAQYYPDLELPFTGYVTVKSKNPKIKIKSIQIKQGHGTTGFKWKNYKINSNKKTIKLGKNVLAMVYQDGNWGQLTYIIRC